MLGAVSLESIKRCLDINLGGRSYCDRSVIEQPVTPRLEGFLTRSIGA